MNTTTPDYGMYTLEGNRNIHNSTMFLKKILGRETESEILLIVESMLNTIAKEFPEATDTEVRESVMRSLNQ